jgi:hypothetical protein
MPPYNTIVVTPFTLPTVVFDNGQVTGNPWNNPSNLFLVDTEYSQSNVNQGVASDVTVGGYNFEYNGISIPQGAVITGIELQVIGYRGAQTIPAITLDISLYDNVDGADDFYPYTTGFTGLTTTDTTTVLGTPSYLFATSFTVDQINNLKMNLKGNGDISLDSFLVRVYFYIPAPTPAPTPSPSVCIDCESPIQVQEMSLAVPFLSGETKFYLKKGSLSYPNGVPVQPGDVGSCGGKLFFVFDEGKKKEDGNFEENVTVDTNTGGWSVLPSGIIEVDIFATSNRGLDYKQPATHVATNMSNHDANSKVIISNNTPYNLTLVRTCQADLVFSPPINVEQEGANIVDPIHTLNFKGTGVTVAQNGGDPYQADITIPGAGTGAPITDNTSSATGGTVQVPTLSWTHTSAGTNRLLTVQVSMEEGKTVTGITYNGVAMTFEIADEQGGTRSEIWSLVGQSVGTHTIVVTFSANSYCSAGAESWTNVDQGTPIGATNSATGASLTPSLVLNTTYDNSVVVDGLSTDLTPILMTPGAGQTENWHRYANTDTRQGASSYESAGSAPDAITMSWAITQNTDWSLCAVEIKGITNAISTLTVKDEGVVVDASVTEMDFAGAGVTVTPVAGGKVLVTIPGGGGGGLNLEVDGTPNGDQTLLNLISGTGIQITDDGVGGVTIEATGASSGAGVNRITVQDDFIGGSEHADNSTTELGTMGELGWTPYASPATTDMGDNIPGEVGHPGIFQLGGANNQLVNLHLNSSVAMVDGSIYRYIVRPNVAAGHEYEFGLGRDGVDPEQANRITIHVQTSAGYSDFETSDNANTVERTNIGAIASGDWVEVIFKVVSGATAVECYIGLNGVPPTLAATHSTNIPLSTAPLYPIFAIVDVGANTLDIDYFSMYDPDASAQVGGGGGGSEKKVGVGETSDVNWYNFQPLFIDDGTAKTWNISNPGTGDSFSHIGDSTKETSAILEKVFPDLDNLGAIAAMRYVDARQFIMQGSRYCGLSRNK